MRSGRKLALCALFLLSLGLLSCSGSLFRNYGRITPTDRDATELETGTVQPELRYYASGPIFYPNALVGLNRDYRLDRETLWREIHPMTPAKLREIVGEMKTKASQYRQFPHEFDLLDMRGKKIGFWYSLPTARTFLRFEEDETVMLPTPDLEIYEKLEPQEDKE